MSIPKLHFPWICLALIAFLGPLYGQFHVPDPSEKPYWLFSSSVGIGFGARALAMGGAFIAVADDITGINYNPAGLAQLIKPEFSFGGRFGGQSFSSSGFYSSDGVAYQSVAPFHSSFNRLGFDYAGFVLPFRLGSIWVVPGVSYANRALDTARYSYTTSQIKGDLNQPTSDVQTVLNKATQAGSTSTVTFSLAVRPLDFLYLGLNVNLWDRELRFNNVKAYFNLATGWSSEWQNHSSDRFHGGANVDIGLLLKFPKFSLGAIYRSAYHAVDKAYSELASLYGALYGWESFTGTLHWPYSYGIGISIHPFEPFTVSADYDFQKWSNGIFVGQTQNIYYYDPVSTQFNYLTAHDTWQLRLGTEYVVMKTGQIIVPVRAGGFIDTGYQTNKDNRPAKFKGLTCGIGFVVERVTIDLAAIYSHGSYQRAATEQDFDGLVWSDAVKLSFWDLLLSVSFKLWK